MEKNIIKPFGGIIYLGLLIFTLLLTPALLFAQVSSDTIAQFTSVPINLTDSDVTPQVMINASIDHQLFFKAFNDYTDLDGDTLADTTYKNSIEYYGYFDSYKCYEYNSTDKRFEPKAINTTRKCPHNNNTHWSGNFLNWVSMARIDVVRKILFGGHRRVDGDNATTGTILERAYLPHDAHSWVKYYKGNDIEELTPFVDGVDYTLVDADEKKNGITFANTTDVNMGNYGGNDFSEDFTEPPLIKVIAGNYSLWASNERWQCTWRANSPEGDNHNGTNANASADSGINAYSSSPAYGDGLGEKNYVARVQVAVPGLLGTEKCKLYPGVDGNMGTADDVYKPIGLLQIYGDNDQMHFAMMAGTYNKHTSGGEITRNMGSMQDEINVSTTGTFKKVSVDAGGPEANADAEGIINAWSLYRITGYNGSDGTYRSGSGDDCNWGLSAVAALTDDDKCQNWGNPFAEIFLNTIRYYANKGNTIQFRSTDDNKIAGLPKPENWTDPLDISNYCARLNVINLNTSILSFDHDELDDATYGVTTIWDNTDLPGDKSSKAMTDVVGDGENIHGNSYFIGEIDVSNQADADDQMCTSKICNSFGNAGGPCPEVPRLQGSYRIAGLAYYAHIKDIRPSGLTHELIGIQKIDTYSVAMSSAVPAIEIPHPLTGVKSVTILPACRNTSLNPDGNCAIVNFQIVSQVQDAGGGIGTGKFYINWEDSEQGGDYDQDMWGILEYTINSATNKLTITTNAIAKSTPYLMGFGYILDGTTEDGFHAHSGINSYVYDDPATITAGADCVVNCQVANAASTAEYDIGGGGTSLLKDPLWYAAKWGGFIDSDGNNTPNLQSEWDKVNNSTGASGTDGIPDNYFYANDPSQLEASLNRVFLAILQRASSGTAAAVVSNNVSGVGALYQAYYEPLRKDALGNEVNWLGTLQSLWLDSYGYLREDNDGDATLDGYLTDSVIQMVYDEIDNKTKVRRYVSTNDDVFSPHSITGTVTAYNAGTGSVTFTVTEISGTGSYSTWDVYNLTNNMSGTSVTTSTINIANIGLPLTFTVLPQTSWISIGDTIMVAHFDYNTIGLEDIQTIWNGREQLSFSTADPAIQRPFTNKADGLANGGRHIKTWIDTDGDSVVDATEIIDFKNSSFNATNFGFFNVDTLTDAQDLTDYIRGKEIAGYRNRTIDYDANGSTEVIRLGDIVNSTPTVVGSTQERLDLIYKDDSYVAFKTKYANRRQVVYVGSNGGMLHAFNGGFYDSDTQSFLLTDGGGTTVEHPLGAEIWAYVPMNLLPHLKWLKDNNYTHVYYVDAKPKVFDAKIFANDPDHPNGWGTVLVVGMRFGGGAMTIDTGADGLGTGTDRELRSAYIIMDITNPEVAPKLLAEIQVPDGSFSTSYSAAFAVKEDLPAVINKWFLTFGSGPTSITSGDSDQTAKFYTFDLDEIANPGSSSGSIPFGGQGARIDVGTGGTMKILQNDTLIDDSFVGHPISVDWDLNYKADSVYFGIMGDSNAISGRVMRFAINEKEDWSNWNDPATLINTSQPVSSGVTPGLDESGQKWIFFGSGRFLVSADQSSTATQSIYGVKEDGLEIFKLTGLVDVSDAQVEPDGDLTTPIDSQTTLTDLKNRIETTYDGWYFDLPLIVEDVPPSGTEPATRVLSQSALAGGVLFTAAYQPGIDPCSGEGYSRLYGLYYKTGTAPIGLLDGNYFESVFGTDTDGGGKEYTVPFIELGHGMATSPSLHSGSNTGKDDPSGHGGDPSKQVTVFTQLSTGTIVRSKAKTDTVRNSLQSWIEP